MKTKPREHVVKVRLSPVELETVTAHAKAEGVPLSTYLRRMAVTARPSPGGEADRVKRALAAFDSFDAGEVASIKDGVREVRKGWTRGGR